MYKIISIQQSINAIKNNRQKQNSLESYKLHVSDNNQRSEDIIYIWFIDYKIISMQGIHDIDKKVLLVNKLHLS